VTGTAVRRSEPRRVTEAQVVDAAMWLLDMGGPAAASIRRIAAAMDVAPQAVYTYFPDTASVGRAVVERLIGEVVAATEPGTDAKSWQDDLEALALRVSRRFADHPGTVPLVVAGSTGGPNERRLAGRVRELLTAAGLDAADADWGTYLIGVYVLGAATRPDSEARFVWGLRRLLAGLCVPLGANPYW